MIKRIYADNYRSLVNFECSLSPRQLILGSNGSGKSSIFDILALLRDSCGQGHWLNSRRIASKIGIASRTRWQDILEQSFELDVAGNGGEYQLRLVIESETESSESKIVEEKVDFSGSPIFQRTQEEIRFFDSQSQAWKQFPMSLPPFISAIGTLR